MIQTFIIAERALNDDTLHLSSLNRVFKGGYVAVLEQYTYANEWSDHQQIKSFRKLDSLYKYLNKYYPNLEKDLGAPLEMIYFQA